LAPSGTERHRDQTSDQARDQATKSILGRDLEQTAERLLRAVAEGAPESVELAKELVVVVLGAETVKRAVALDELLRKQSPLALVRSVVLAESLLRLEGRVSGLVVRGGQGSWRRMLLGCPWRRLSGRG
jgi:hypothetical protein